MSSFDWSSLTPVHYAVAATVVISLLVLIVKQTRSSSAPSSSRKGKSASKSSSRASSKKKSSTKTAAPRPRNVVANKGWEKIFDECLRFHTPTIWKTYKTLSQEVDTQTVNYIAQDVLLLAVNDEDRDWVGAAAKELKLKSDKDLALALEGTLCASGFCRDFEELVDRENDGSIAYDDFVALFEDWVLPSVREVVGYHDKSAQVKTPSASRRTPSARRRSVRKGE